MSKFTNFGENKIADKFRGTEPPYATSWFFALGSAASDSTFTEITGANLARVGLVRSLANFAGTQGAGTTVASSGTSHTTSNNVDVQYGAAAANLAAPATHVGLFDAVSGGNCWIWLPLASPITVNLGDSPPLAAGSIVVSLGLTGGCTDFLSNKLIDEIFRGQAYPWPATTYLSLFSAPPSNAGGGTELSYSGYARVALPSTMTELSGTQGAGTTSASSGTGGRVSNNLTKVFPSPGSDATTNAGGLHDLSAAGNLLFWKDFAAKSITANGSAPTLAPNAFAFNLD